MIELIEPGVGWFSTPQVRAGQSAALAVGTATPQVVVLGAGLAVRPYDARVLDQPQADAFLAEVRRRVEAFEDLL
jgi:pyruvate/2-oxoglutarate dehydrogenase complex dihydrolipoamide acyltransferase (E2) component